VEIQRSSNGIEFEPLTFVPGNGTTNVPQQYHYEDAGLAVGNYHYRLKQLDFDGSFMLTDVLTVDLNPPKSFSLFPGYPNPFTEQITLNFELPTATNVEIRIFNMLGQQVRTLTSADMRAGFHQVNWNGTSDLAQSLPNGYYFLRFSADGNSQTQRLLLLR
ncbi:T9SS type A sorting domain-containing protein, partial [bacterium]|nr:T9SS type A sorting domain-containing protein [bacterium]